MIVTHLFLGRCLLLLESWVHGAALKICWLHSVKQPVIAIRLFSPTIFEVLGHHPCCISPIFRVFKHICWVLISIMFFIVLTEDLRNPFFFVGLPQFHLADLTLLRFAIIDIANNVLFRIWVVLYVDI